MTASRKRAERPNTDLLYGVRAIGAHLGLTARQAEHLIARGQLPVFRLGGTICQRKSALDGHLTLAAAEAEQRPARRYSADAITPSPLAEPTLLYGHRAIAAHLGLPAADVARMDLERRLPTYLDDGCTVASTAALDHWNSAGLLPSPAVTPSGHTARNIY